MAAVAAYKKKDMKGFEESFAERLENLMEANLKVGDKVHCPSGFCKITKIKGKKITILTKSDGEIEYDSKSVSKEAAIGK